MLEMLRDMVAHKGYANAVVLGAIGRNGAAAADPELFDLLHHILLSNRFWVVAILRVPFILEDESRPSSSFDALIERFDSMQDVESSWLATATDADLGRMLHSDLIPGGQCSVAQAIVQVCMHSHGHRAQCAKLLRRHGGVPPVTDFISWLASRPAAD